MLSDDELRNILRHGEADHVERTQSANERRKFGEAICAFANDLPDRRQIGVLLVGVRDNGDCANIPIEEQLLQTLMGFRTDGTILPPPAMHVAATPLTAALSRSWKSRRQNIPQSNTMDGSAFELDRVEATPRRRRNEGL